MSAVPSPRSHPLHFAAFISTTTAGPVPGHWPPALPRQSDFGDLERWVRLARTLERGKFDAVFFAGAAGLPARRRRDEGGYAEGRFRTPGSDASVLAGAIAYATRHLGIAVTASVVQEDPLNFARRISTLDHASNGRIAWHVAGDPPGEWTQEYADVTYKLWEGSWDEDALRPDGRDGDYGRGGKVHRINHRGPRYQVAGPHPISPSPQRTPLLFQAGASEADRVFAARNAEVVFLQSPSPAAAGHDTADVRARAARHGRLPQDIMFFQALHVVTGGTEAEARQKAAALDEQVGAAPLPSRTAASGRIAGTPEQIADELASWRDAGLDGVHLVNAGRSPAPYEEFVDHVAPVLQGRGLMQREYADGSLRHKLFGRGDRVSDRHPAARYRGAFAPQHV
jgi:alkanesulfonate monooxygenase SsuD/methylene tetrahydromethanopterin reductase-like flavin-dependent oxidoreductase (luciferase family)